MSPTPGWVKRSRAISALTLWPGSWPPSPGFEPWAILMFSSSANAQYSGVTPNRPDAICLMRELRSHALPAGAVPGRVLAALAAVALAAEHVHRDRERLVGLGREGAVRHRAGGEPAGDGLGRLDLAERQRRAGRDELEEVVQLGHGPALDELPVPVVEVVATLLHHAVQQVGGLAVDGFRLGHEIGQRQLAAVVAHLRVEHDDPALVLGGRRRHVREPAVDRRLGRSPRRRLVLLVRRVDDEPDRRVQRLDDRVRVVGVVLAAALAEADEAGLLEHRPVALERRGVASEHVGAEHGETDPVDGRCRVRQARLGHLAGDPDGLEDLRAAVAVDGRDAHLRHDLEDAVLDRRLVARLRRRGGQLAEPVVVGHRRDRLERQARTDRVGAVAEQARHRVGVAGVARVDDDRARLPEPLVDEAPVERAEREQRRDRRPLLAQQAVGDDDDARAPRTDATPAATSVSIPAARPSAPPRTGKVASRRVAGNTARAGSSSDATASE